MQDFFDLEQLNFCMIELTFTAVFRMFVNELQDNARSITEKYESANLFLYGYWFITFSWTSIINGGF